MSEPVLGQHGISLKKAIQILSPSKAAGMLGKERDIRLKKNKLESVNP
jgi:hypothetical protein